MVEERERKALSGGLFWRGMGWVFVRNHRNVLVLLTLCYVRWLLLTLCRKYGAVGGVNITILVPHGNPSEPDRFETNAAALVAQVEQLQGLLAKQLNAVNTEQDLRDRLSAMESQLAEAKRIAPARCEEGSPCRHSRCSPQLHEDVSAGSVRHSRHSCYSPQRQDDMSAGFAMHSRIDAALDGALEQRLEAAQCRSELA
eukprot:3876456-Amphidinium_carterae.1